LETEHRSEVLGSVAEIPTRRLAEQLFADRLRPINSGELRPNSTRTFRDYGESWLVEVLPTVKYSTGRHYKYFVRFHLYPTFGHMQLRLITRDAVQKFLSVKLQSGLSWKTVKHMRTVFGTVMGAAETAELIPANPVRKTRFPRCCITRALSTAIPPNHRVSPVSPGNQIQYGIVGVLLYGVTQQRTNHGDSKGISHTNPANS
jgi:integrase-like protein